MTTPPDRWAILSQDTGDYLPARYSSEEAAQTARRVLYGNRALAHPIVKFPGSLKAEKGSES